MTLNELYRSGNATLSREAAQQSRVIVVNVTDGWLTVGIVASYF